MKMREKLKTSIGKLRLKIAAGVAGISTGIMMMPVTAMAGEVTAGGDGNGLNATDAANKVQEIVGPILQFVAAGMGVVGAIFAFMGIWKIANAFRNDNNPEAISSGAKDLVVGALFIALGLIGMGTKGFDFLFPKAS